MGLADRRYGAADGRRHRAAGRGHVRLVPGRHRPAPPPRPRLAVDQRGRASPGRRRAPRAFHEPRSGRIRRDARGDRCPRSMADPRAADGRSCVGVVDPRARGWRGVRELPDLPRHGLSRHVARAGHARAAAAVWAGARRHASNARLPYRAALADGTRSLSVTVVSAVVRSRSAAPVRLRRRPRRSDHRDHRQRRRVRTPGHRVRLGNAPHRSITSLRR